MGRGFGAAVEFDQPRVPQILDALAGGGDAHAGLAGDEQRAHRGLARIGAERLQGAPEMQRVGRRAQHDGRLEADHDIGAGTRIHAAAGQGRQAHFGQRVLHAPGPDMGAVAGDHEHRVAVAEIHGVQRPRIGPGP